MKRVLVVLLAALAAASRAHAAGSALLGGFQPVAVEDGARGAWICPAGIAFRGASQLVLEGVFVEGADGGYGDLSYLTLAAATDHRAYGWQLEIDDVSGVPDWTLVAAHVVGDGNRGPRLGTAFEWRGGEKNKLDATLSAFLPVGRTLRAAVAVEDLFRSEIDGVDADRSWRGGVAARGRRGWLSWDWRGLEDGPARHFLGAGIETPWFRTSGAVDDDGGWEAEARLVLGERAGGGGLVEPDAGSPSRFATLEMGGAGRRRPR